MQIIYIYIYICIGQLRTIVEQDDDKLSITNYDNAGYIMYG